MIWASFSLLICLEEVPELIREWKPEQQEREERLAGRVLPSVESGAFHGGSAGEGGADNGDDRNDHHCIEQEGAQVVTRLEQNPDRKQRSNRDVHSNEEHPTAMKSTQKVRLKCRPMC